MWFDNVLIFFVPIIFYHWLYAYVIGNAWSWIPAICCAEEESGDLMGAGGETFQILIFCPNIKLFSLKFVTMSKNKQTPCHLIGFLLGVAFFEAVDLPDADRCEKVIVFHEYPFTQCYTLFNYMKIKLKPLKIFHSQKSFNPRYLWLLLW